MYDYNAGNEKKKIKTNVKLHVILKYALKHYYKTKS